MGTQKDFYIAGIGASAGGLEAIESFLSGVPLVSGIAYVIVQHLSPDYKSLMPEILIKHTSLPVHTAEDGMQVEPDNIYLIPRKMNMKIFRSKLHLTEKTSSQGLNLPIDIFFHSLAEDFEDKAIGIILSGTGSDGSRGIRQIKENGGIVLVQDPDSSKFDGMPKSAITTGTVDFILPPHEMPEKILSYVKHPYIAGKSQNGENAIVPEDYLAKIILLIKENSGLDFTYYKDSTISRRIERRMSINQVEQLKDYLQYLYTSKNEQRTLYKELLIGVTRFFRDPEAFQIIRDEIIPEIFKGKSGSDEIRVWVSACSTGEEAYSVAILFKEYLTENHLNNEVKIFATDVDKSSIEFASAGIYNASIIADLSMERLSRYFTPAGDSFRITDDIREMIVFASHNLIKDPPFNKIDFLSCRNFLIYLQAPLQQKVLSLFNFALGKNGVLFLGSSESIGEMEHYFETIHIKWKIFKAKSTGKLPNDILTSKFPHNLYFNNFKARKPVYTLRNSNQDLAGIFTEKILSDLAPVTVITDEDCHIINTYGDPNQYLVIPASRKISDGFEFVLTKMVPANLKLTFSISISKALKTNQSVFHENIRYEKPGAGTFVLDLQFVPLVHEELKAKYVIIYFKQKELPNNQAVEVKSFDDLEMQAQQRIFDLENELKHVRENLQASIEELETTNEELQSTNEELISANEELQSTNEELQSVNEELYTVNTEFQAKNHDLMVMNNDMENLMLNSEIRIIFLDLNLRVRKFTHTVTEIVNLKKNDIGRPLSDITHHIVNTDLFRKAKQVIKDHSIVQKVVKAQDKWFQLKILPYTDPKGFVDGVVISFIDISDFYKAQADLKISEDKCKTLVDNGFDAYYLLQSKRNDGGEIVDFLIAEVNQKAELQLKMTRDKLIGNGICELFPVNRSEGYFEIYKNVVETNKPYQNEYCIPNDYAAPGWYYHQVVPAGDGVAILNRDISARKNAEIKLQETTKLFESLFHQLNMAFALHEIITNECNEPVDYKFIEVNEKFEILTGLKKENILGNTVKQLMPDTEEFWIKTYGKVALMGDPIVFEHNSQTLGKKFKVKAYSPRHGQFVTLFEECEN